MNSITSPFAYLSQAQQIMSLRRHSWIKKVLNQAGFFRWCVVVQGWPGPWWREFTHFSQTEIIWKKKKGMISADLVFWCIVGNPFENFHICYFAIVPPPKKSRSNWASEAARSGRGLGFKGVGVWILGVLIFLIPTGSARFRSIKKRGGGDFWELYTPQKFTWTALSS